jgi:hypothetical protein
MSSLHGRGACLLHLGRGDEAIDCFRQALQVYPHHVQSTLGLAVALRSIGSLEAAQTALREAATILDTLTRTRPLEAALVRAQLLTVEGRLPDAGARLCQALDDAPPGFAGWTLPVEPFLQPLRGTPAFESAVGRLSQRTR